MISYLKRTVHDDRIRKLKDFEVGCWINVVGPSEKEILYLTKRFKLDKENLLSGLDQNELPRLDIIEDDEKEDIYIFIKTIIEEPKQALQTYLIVISKQFILTLSKDEPNFIKEILENRVEFITTQKLKSLIGLFSKINKEFEKSTINIIKVVNAKKAITSKLKEKNVNNLLEKEDILNSFVSSYHHMSLLYQRIIKSIRFYEEDKEIIEDLMVEAEQGFDLCKSSLKSISNIRNYYLIILSNKLNRIITILTIFTVFISIPAAISGIYGMNINLPLQKNPLIFSYILFFIIFVWIIFLIYFKKKDII
jgi:magnesium transporter